MRLTFENKQFILKADTRKEWSAVVENIPHIDRRFWQMVNAGERGTTRIQAAAKFRSIADKKAEKIFERVFIERYPLPSSPLPSFLDAHQLDGVRWVLTRSRAYLAHAPGAGKTLEALTAFALARGEGQGLFIVPPSLTANWKREIENYRTLSGVKGSSLPIEKLVATVPLSVKKEEMNWSAPIILCPDSMLTRPWVLSQLAKLKLKVLAVDEASRFKEHTAQRTLALLGGELNDGRKSPGLFKNARHTVLLDGSPMPNGNAMELWAPTIALAPEAIDFLNYENFGHTYCKVRVNEFGKTSFSDSVNSAALKSKLTESFMHIVTEDELSHPERLRSILLMNEDPRSPTCRAWETKNFQNIFHSLQSKTFGDDAAQGELARYRRELGLGKIKWVGDYVIDRLREKNESILVFAWHRKVCEGLAHRLRNHNPALIMGGTNAETREYAFARFQAGQTRVIVGNIAAMGRGHNLQNADRAVFAEYSWSDELNKQCEKRASRRGSTKKSVRCEYVVVPESLDETILRSVFRKAASVKRVIG